LEGEKAPDWVLTSADNNLIDFNDLKSKVLLIEFTGIGCGPCHKAIPFLNELESDFKDKDIKIISIETWGADIERITKYRNHNNIDYNYLQANKKVKSDYDVLSVPIFFILDENRIIRKVINGYGAGITDKQIRNLINELI